ncbi:hypothetical protein H8356DRAFT_1619187 [Neocallimastix lanati (nom. inval.)]|nr:hypothetical protein H8356DRAFT_1619187 [Neocallimastix sp. JGI-2020a]
MGLEIIDKNSPETNTCYNKNYTSFYQGVNEEFRDTFFFAYIIQFMIIALIYFNMGKGIYWKVLLYASLIGLLGGIIEHCTLAYICEASQKEKKTRVFTFFICEFFWIVGEYSIPYLNLLKMETIAERKSKRTIEWIVYFFFIPFVIARLIDGYDRMMEGVLNTKISERCHGVAYGSIAIADISCTIGIIYFINKKINRGLISYTTLGKYFMNSSYTTLILVDIVSVFLSILYLVTTLSGSDSDFSSSPMPFHCLKTDFLLILAVDAMIFRGDIKNVNSKSTYFDNSHFQTITNK